MKHSYVILAPTFIVSLTSTKAFAYDSLVDGVYYVLSNTLATFTYFNLSDIQTTSTNRPYKDIVNFPATFTYNGKKYLVTKIGATAFRYCDEVTAVSIPFTLTRNRKYVSVRKYRDSKSGCRAHGRGSPTREQITRINNHKDCASFTFVLYG